MAKKSGLRPLWNKNDIKKMFDKVGEDAERIIVGIFQQAGEEFVKFARMQAPENSFYDHTQNLRNSIGFVIVRDGRIIREDFKEQGGGKEGVVAARQLCSELARTYSSGYVLIGVAGMKYAAYVEAIESKDVITRAASFTEEHIKNMGQSLFKRLSI
ncbi:HK97 gp10 family phage protein [Bacteroides sp. 51]|uniref:HK97 gp10 family phage protein n=1 Tax=Bacteroides sp. 51 TaxID=2302938 RepID=UPI0013D23DB8|nr:HK97 gp10 family phage protein [Bacteroides sp. 51]NDV81334.1 hypothetical protein [Bacteroides sp. 51]